MNKQEKGRAAAARFKKRNPDKVRQYNKETKGRRLQAGLCRTCGKLPYIEECTQCQLCIDKAKERYRRNKRIVYEHYGRVCVCCGEAEESFLSIDHINNDGVDRRKVHGNGSNFYTWIIANQYPDDLQILCMNCQWGKRTHGRCPHQDPESPAYLGKRDDT